MIESPYNTSLFLKTSVITRATQISSLIWHLGEAGLDYRKDEFLSSVVDTVVVTELRDIKYRGRILVDDGMTLYGIMDETGYLQEGQLFVINEQHAQSSYQGLDGPVVGGRQVLVQNGIIITRSPAMHPGDVQLVNAVNVPEDSPSQQLRNVVVFSQHGARDLPSQLSGGDLGGDIYNVIFDKTLRPAVTYVAAEYPRLSPVKLDHPVTARDMSEFFVTFMETDQLGMLCNVHMQLVDQRPLGTLDHECIKIAGMASTAVDFSKTGIAVDMKQLPKYDRFRPDFMAPSPCVHVTETGEVEIEKLDEINDDAFEGIDEERRPLRYYKSQEVLGQLYRNIGEKRFLDDMHQHKSRVWSATSSHGFIKNLCNYVLHQASLYGVLYEGYMDLARNIRAGLVDILYANSSTVNIPLSEAEAFAGTILGRQGGSQGRTLRELSNTMRERFEAVCEYYTMRIIQGDAAMHQAEYLDALYDVEEREIEAWPRAIACLVVACGEKGLPDYRLGELKSFKYLTAATCLRELERTRKGLGKHGPLPTCGV